MNPHAKRTFWTYPTALSAFLIALSLVYLLLLAMFRIPDPTDMIRLAIGNPWTIDSTEAQRVFAMDSDDWYQSRKPGFCSYNIIVCCSNNTAVSFRYATAELIDVRTRARLARVSLHGIVRGQSTAFIGFSFWEASQSFLISSTPAPIDGAFDNRSLAAIINTSHGLIEATIDRYKTVEKKVSAGQLRAWHHSGADDLVTRADWITHANPDSALALLSAAIRVDSTYSLAYLRMAAIYNQRNETERASAVIAAYEHYIRTVPYYYR